MTLSKYQQLAERTLTDNLRHSLVDRRLHAICGLSSESGEVAGVWQKYLRGDYDYEAARSKIKDELGDVLWDATEACSAFDLGADDVAADNLDKLQSRQSRGTIRGSDRDE